MSEQANGCRWSRPRPRGLAGLVRAPGALDEKPGQPVDPVRRHGRHARPPGHLASRGARRSAARAVWAAAPAGRHLPAQAAALWRLLIHRRPPVGPGAAARGQCQGARAGERLAARGSPRPPCPAAPRPPRLDGNEFLPLLL